MTKPSWMFAALCTLGACRTQPLPERVATVAADLAPDDDLAAHEDLAPHIDLAAVVDLHAGVVTDLAVVTADLATTPAWFRANNGLPPGYVYALAADRSQLGTIYAGSYGGGGLYKTIDSGQHWQPIDDGLGDGEISAIAIDSQDAQRLLVGTSNGLYRSLDGGAHWSWIDHGGTIKQIFTVTTDPNVGDRWFTVTRDGVYRTADAGAHFTRLFVPDIVPYDFPYRVTVDTSDSSHLFLAHSGATSGVGLYTSHDGGDSWTPMASQPGTQAFDVAYDPARGLLCVVADERVYGSGDGGATWTVGLGGANLESAHLAGGQFYAAGYGAGIFRSSDCKTWSQVSDAAAYTVVTDPSGAIYAGLLDASGGGVLRSADGVTAWQRVNVGLENGDVHAIAIDPATPSRLALAVSWDGIYRSDDAAASWASAPSSLVAPSGYFTHLAVDSAVLIGAYDRKDFVSFDDGASFAVGLLPLNPSSTGTHFFNGLALDPLHLGNHTIFAAATSSFQDPPVGLFTSTDDGLTWQPNAAAAFNGITVAVDPTQAGALWMIGGAANQTQTVYRSADAGASFTPVALPLAGRPSVLALAPSDGQTVYVGVTNAGIARSRDGGASFTIVGKPTVGWYTVLVVDPLDADVVYLGANVDQSSSAPLTGDSGLWKSRDGGASWRLIGPSVMPSAINALAIDPQNSQRVYAATRDDGLYSTVTGGE